MASGDVHLARVERGEMPRSEVGYVQGVPGVEVRGQAAEVIIEILRDWVDNQYRRTRFLQTRMAGGGNLKELSREVEAIGDRLRVVEKVIGQWEGVLTLPPNPDDRVTIDV